MLRQCHPQVVLEGRPSVEGSAADADRAALPRASRLDGAVEQLLYRAGAALDPGVVVRDAKELKGLHDPEVVAGEEAIVMCFRKSGPHIQVSGPARGSGRGPVQRSEAPGRRPEAASGTRGRTLAPDDHLAVDQDPGEAGRHRPGGEVADVHVSPSASPRRSAYGDRRRHTACRSVGLGLSKEPAHPRPLTTC